MLRGASGLDAAAVTLKSSITQVTIIRVGRVVGLPAIEVGLRLRGATIYIIMEVAAGSEAVNKSIHTLTVAQQRRDVRPHTHLLYLL